MRSLIFTSLLAISSFATSSAWAIYNVAVDPASTSQKYFLNTNEVKTKANLQLVNTVTSLEAAGAIGRWFKSVSPFSADNHEEYFYWLEKATVAVNQNSEMWLFRTKNSLRLLNEKLKMGAPIILSIIPQETQIMAAAIGGSNRLATDLTTNAKLSQKTIILIEPNTNEFIFAHEFQHWLDFEDQAFFKKLSNALEPFFTNDALTEEELDSLFHIVWEIRGHSAQAIQALDDKDKKLPILNRAGTIIVDDKKAQSMYVFEADDIKGIYLNTYASSLFTIATKIKARSALNYSKFIKTMASFDLSNNPKAGISFKSILSP